jgi:hypothetical protein
MTDKFKISKPEYCIARFVVTRKMLSNGNNMPQTAQNMIVTFKMVRFIKTLFPVSRNDTKVPMAAPITSMGMPVKIAAGATVGTVIMTYMFCNSTIKSMKPHVRTKFFAV